LADFTMPFVVSLISMNAQSGKPRSIRKSLPAPVAKATRVGLCARR
jgi:hypothetical protein